MPKVHKVEHARKDYPEIGVKKGESYFWWKIKTGPASGIKKKSKEPPKPSQLTNSTFMSTLLGIQEGAAFEEMTEFEDLDSHRNDIVSELESLRDDTQSSLDNMPEGLQQGDTGQMLAGRVEALDSMIDELTNVSCDDDVEDLGEDATKEEQDKAKEAALQNVRDELDNALNNYSGE